MRFLCLALLLIAPLAAQTAGEWNEIKASDGSPMPRMDLRTFAGEVYGTGIPAHDEKRFTCVWHLKAGVATPVLKPDNSQLAYNGAISVDNRALFVERTGMTAVQHIWIVAGNKATPLLDPAGAHMRIDGQTIAAIDNHQVPAVIWNGASLGGDDQWHPRQDACSYFILRDDQRRSIALWRIDADKASKVELPPKTRGPSFAWTGKRLVMFAFRAAWFVDGKAPEQIKGADGDPLKPVFAGNVFATGDYLLHYVTWEGALATLYRWKGDQLQEIPLPENHKVAAILETGRGPYLVLSDGMRKYLYECDGAKVKESNAIKLDENRAMGRVVSCGDTFIVQVHNQSARDFSWHVVGETQPVKVKFPPAPVIPVIEAAYRGPYATILQVRGDKTSSVSLLDASGRATPLEGFESEKLAYVVARFAKDGTYLTAMINDQNVMFYQPAK